MDFQKAQHHIARGPLDPMYSASRWFVEGTLSERRRLIEKFGPIGEALKNCGDHVFRCDSSKFPNVKQSLCSCSYGKALDLWREIEKENGK